MSFDLSFKCRTSFAEEPKQWKVGRAASQAHSLVVESIGVIPGANPQLYYRSSFLMYRLPHGFQHSPHWNLPFQALCVSSQRTSFAQSEQRTYNQSQPKTACRRRVLAAAGRVNDRPTMRGCALFVATGEEALRGLRRGLVYTRASCKASSGIRRPS